MVGRDKREVNSDRDEGEVGAKEGEDKGEKRDREGRVGGEIGNKWYRKGDTGIEPTDRGKWQLEMM
jgi:hypothetical protein